MFGDQIKQARLNRGYSLEELGQIVGKSEATMSRIETNPSFKFDSVLFKKIADALGTSVSYLVQDQVNEYITLEEVQKLEEDQMVDVIVEDDDMSPELPEDAIVRIRGLLSDEQLQEGSFYCITFNNQKKFRMVIDDEVDGIGFMPMDKSERRIAYDLDYVTVIGKAISMKVFFEDEIVYE